MTEALFPRDAECRRTRDAERDLRTMQALLPAYREVCGEAPYLYALSEVERLERELVGSLSADDLTSITRSITSQLQGLAWAIRRGRGRGIEPDA